MTKHKTLPRWGQWATGSVLLTVALAAGITGLTLNVRHGLETGLAAGIIFGLADIGKIVIPLTAAAIGWTFQTRATAVICVIVSVWCAINLYADQHGRQLLQRQSQATAWSGAQQDLTRARAELASIAETGSPESLRQLAKAANERAAREEGNGGCGKRCEAAKAEAAQFAQRAGQAERKAKLETMLDTAKHEAQASGGPAEISGLAAIIAAWTSFDEGTVARSIGAVKALFFLALIEALVWLNVPAATQLAQAMKARTKPKDAKAPAKPRAKKAPAKAKAKPKAAPKDWTKVEAYGFTLLPKGKAPSAAQALKGKAGNDNKRSTENV